MGPKTTRRVILVIIPACPTSSRLPGLRGRTCRTDPPCSRLVLETVHGSAVLTKATYKQDVSRASSKGQAKRTFWYTAQTQRHASTRKWIRLTTGILVEVELGLPEVGIAHEESHSSRSRSHAGEFDQGISVVGFAKAND